MHELVRERPRFGYRRVWALLRSEGWRVNRKRVYRLWRREGFKVPRKVRKRRRLGASVNACHRRRSLGKDDVWTWDFIHDRTSDGRPLKWLSIVDEHTRECLALEVGRGLNAQRVIATLERLLATRGTPACLRSDNGPEFIARRVRAWFAGRGVSPLFVAPGSPWENGYAEAFHSRLRDELLAREEFETLLEAKAVSGQWRADYNERRPHGALGYRTPSEFARGCGPAPCAALRAPSLTPEQTDSLS